MMFWQCRGGLPVIDIGKPGFFVWHNRLLQSSRSHPSITPQYVELPCNGSPSSCQAYRSSTVETLNDVSRVIIFHLISQAHVF